MNIAIEHLNARHPAARAGAPGALRGVALELWAGESVAIIGPSGAGKTTLLQILACALQPASGHLRLDGVDPWTLSRSGLHRLRREFFLAPQVPPLPPRQRVVTAVLAARLPRMNLLQSIRSLVYPSDIAAAFAALEAFDLADKLFERVDRLSGGERQRVGLARALIANSRLWLVDEPLSALDPTRASMALSVLQQQARERGVTLVATLHQVEMALSHFPRIIGLRDGQVAFDLPASQVSEARLRALYAQAEHELLSPWSPAAQAGNALEATLAGHAQPTAPAVMHCR
ncbi:MAG: phosphonate ABC transporter ATP-binding protein [Burkholderiaceae bacterium]